jgi:HAD superfamily hydrolase (TIGR01484 family)
MPPIRAIFCDIDGCLTPEASVPFDHDQFVMLSELLRERHEDPCSPPIILCTGRPQPYVECLLKAWAITSPAICENGAVVYTLTDNHARFTPGVTPAALAGLRAARAYVESELLPRMPGACVQFGKEAQLSIYSPDPGHLEELADAICRFTTREGLPALDINTSHFYLNVSLMGVTKGTAMAAIAAELGLARHQIAAIGDTEGDLAMRPVAGWFACPANARPALRAVADYVSREAETLGVLDILSQPILNP